MANTSILAAFERMWQHVTNRLSGKIDRPSAAIGSSTKPVYISSDGSLTEGSLYAGGTKVQQNGAWVTQANIYAPITQATEANQIIYYDGANTAPQWGGLNTLYYGGVIPETRSQFYHIVLGPDSVGQIFRPLPEGNPVGGSISAYNSSTSSEEFSGGYIGDFKNNSNLGSSFLLAGKNASPKLASDGNNNFLFSAYYRDISTVYIDYGCFWFHPLLRLNEGQTTPAFTIQPYKEKNSTTGETEDTLGTLLTVNYYGNVSAKGSLSGSGGDYAEYLEWLDQNEEVEDRRGLFVSFADVGKEIKIAEPTDDIIGIISSKPSVVGNAAPFEWSKKYLTDAFGIQLIEEIEIPEEILEDGTVIEAHTITQPILNPDYDPEMEYIPREQRPEWAIVGFLGQLVVCDDGTCEVGKYCVCGEGGKATASEGRNGWRVLERIDESHIKVFFK